MCVLRVHSNVRLYLTELRISTSAAIAGGHARALPLRARAGRATQLGDPRFRLPVNGGSPIHRRPHTNQGVPREGGGPQGEGGGAREERGGAKQHP